MIEFVILLILIIGGLLLSNLYFGDDNCLWLKRFFIVEDPEDAQNPQQDRQIPQQTL